MANHHDLFETFIWRPRPPDNGDNNICFLFRENPYNISSNLSLSKANFAPLCYKHPYLLSRPFIRPFSTSKLAQDVLQLRAVFEFAAASAGLSCFDLKTKLNFAEFVHLPLSCQLRLVGRFALLCQFEWSRRRYK